MGDPRALLLTGVYGTGKSAVAAEVAELLETSGQRYAAIDLDWLCWSNVDGSDHGEHDILGQNLAAMARIYRDAGALHFVLAGAVENAATLEAIRVAIGAPMTVIMLTAPLSVIEERLGGASTSGRVADLDRAREWLAAGTGSGYEDAVVENVGPIQETALTVLRVAGWSHSDSG